MVTKTVTSRPMKRAGRRTDALGRPFYPTPVPTYVLNLFKFVNAPVPAGLDVDARDSWPKEITNEMAKGISVPLWSRKEHDFWRLWFRQQACGIEELFPADLTNTPGFHKSGNMKAWEWLVRGPVEDIRACLRCGDWFLALHPRAQRCEKPACQGRTTQQNSAYMREYRRNPARGVTSKK